MWKYITERFAYDVGKAAIRDAANAQRASRPANTVANAILEAQTVWAANVRQLSHRKYELLSVDHYGLLNDEAWIDAWTIFVRHTLVPSLSEFTQDVAMQALGATQATFLAELNQHVLQIARHVSADGDVSAKDTYILANF